MELTSLTIKDRPKSLVQIAQDAIRRGIIQKELKLGQPLKEASLARPLQISNTPVREALSLLKAEGLEPETFWACTAWKGSGGDYPSISGWSSQYNNNTNNVYKNFQFYFLYLQLY